MEVQQQRNDEKQLLNRSIEPEPETGQRRVSCSCLEECDELLSDTVHMQRDLLLLSTTPGTPSTP
jgi:hypothetical protein